MGRNDKYEYNGQWLTRGEIAKISGHPWYLVDARIRAGWDAYRIINTPVRKVKHLNIQKDKDECETKTEVECLNCKRPKCVYDEVRDGRKSRKKV